MCKVPVFTQCTCVICKWTYIFPSWGSNGGTALAKPTLAMLKVRLVTKLNRHFRVKWFGFKTDNVSFLAIYYIKAENIWSFCWSIAPEHHENTDQTGNSLLDASYRMRSHAIHHKHSECSPFCRYWLPYRKCPHLPGPWVPFDSFRNCGFIPQTWKLTSFKK